MKAGSFPFTPCYSSSLPNAHEIMSPIQFQRAIFFCLRRKDSTSMLYESRSFQKAIFLQLRVHLSLSVFGGVNKD